jgi:hypothetical protein
LLKALSVEISRKPAAYFSSFKSSATQYNGRTNALRKLVKLSVVTHGGLQAN